MAFKIASAFVDIGAKTGKLKTGLLKVKGMITGGIGLAFKAAKMIAIAGIAGIGAALAGGIGLVKLGSDLEEMQSKFDAVFKEEAGAAEAFSDSLAKGVGRSKIEIKGFMSGLQDLFVPMGFARDQARELSQVVTGLGVDLASFNNMTDAEAIETLNAGLTGSHEVLKKFGVFINDNVLSLKLQEMGLAKNAQAATEPAKAMARLQIIMESTSDAQGDAMRTSGGLANQWKALKGSLFDLASEIGASLIPAAQKVVEVFKTVAAWAEKNKGKITDFAGTLTEGIGTAIEFVKGIVMRLVDIWQQNWAVMGGIITAVWNLIVSVVGTAISTVIELYLSWIEFQNQLVRTIVQFTGLGGGAFTDFGNIVSSIFGKIKGFVVNVLDKIKEGIKNVVFAFLTWRLTLERVAIAIAEGFDNMLLRIQTFADNVVILFKWIGDNWGDIMFTALDAILTLMINFGKNARKVFSAMWEAIKTGSLKPFQDIDFTPITEGMQSTIRKMPQFKEFIATDAYQDQLDDLNKRTQKEKDRFDKIWEGNAPKVAEEIADEVEKTPFKMPKFDPTKFNIEGTVKGKGGKKGKDKKSEAGQFKGLAAVWKDVQSKLLKGGEDLDKTKVDLAKKQLQETKKQTEVIKDNGNKSTVAVFA